MIIKLFSYPGGPIVVVFFEPKHRYIIACAELQMKQEKNVLKAE